MTEVEAVRGRRRGGVVAVLAMFVLTVLALATAIVVTTVGYSRNEERVDAVASENNQIEQDHAAIGSAFAKQSKELERAIAVAKGAYARGVLEGRRLRTLPRKLRPLERYVGQRFLIPRQIPRRLARQPMRMRREADGYTLRWPRVVLFARANEPLAVWTRTAWPGTQTKIAFGRRQVHRFRAPSGIVYAWTTDNRTYAIQTVRANDRPARSLIYTMR